MSWPTRSNRSPTPPSKMRCCRAARPPTAGSGSHDGFNVEEVVAEYNVLRGLRPRRGRRAWHRYPRQRSTGRQSHHRRSDRPGCANLCDAALARNQEASRPALRVRGARPANAAASDFTDREHHRTHDSTGAANSEQANKLLVVLRRNIQQLEKSVIDVIKANGDSPAGATAKTGTPISSTSGHS